MRSLLALLLLVPALAQQPAEQQTKPEAGADQKAPASAATPDNPAPATEQALTGSVDFGYLWRTNFHGSLNQFRSLVDLNQGPRLFGFEFVLQPKNRRFFDRAGVQVTNLGNEPYNSVHVDVRKRGAYNFTGDYRNMAFFTAEPSFANPFAPAGINHQSYDTRRRTGSADLELFPGRTVTPYLSFQRNSGHGHGVDTWVLESSDEFSVPTLLRDSTNNYRGGVRFEFDRWHVTLEQGGTTFKEDDQTSYADAANRGDRTAKILGQTLVLNNLQQQYGIRGDTIYSKGLVTANPLPWLNLYGQFLFSEPRSDVHFTETAAGNFVTLASLLFYSGSSTVGLGAANAPHITANAGFEMRPFDRLRIIESWMTDRYHDGASPLVTMQLFAKGALSQSLTSALNYKQTVNYNQNQLDVLFDLSKKLTLRGGWRYVWGDATVLGSSLSQTGLMESGELRRHVALAGLTFRPWQKLTLNLDYEGSSSDRVYFRTSLNDYHRARARARFQATQTLGFQANFQVVNNQNPATDIRYDFRSRANSLSVFWTPNGGKRVSVIGEYDRSTLRSNVAYLNLPFLTSATSLYRDNAHTGTALVELTLPGYAGLAPKISAGGSVFTTSGSRSSRWYQPLARLSIPFQKHIYWNTEWQWYGYGEQFYVYEGFRTHIFMTGLRLTL